MKTTPPPESNRLTRLTFSKKWPASALASVLLLAGTANSPAASGTWTNDASSVWSDTTSWLGATIADGTDATADFSTVAISGSRTVTLDSAHSIGNLLFGNPATPATTNWTLAASGGSILTLAVSSGTPAITVTNTAILNAPLAGVSGLAKTGPGTLVMGGANSYTGNTLINAGALKLTNAPSTGPVLYLSFNNVSGSIVTNGGSGGAAMNGLVVGTGVSVVAGGPNGNSALSVGSGAVNAGYVLVNSAGVNFNTNLNWTLGLWMKTSTTGAVYAYQGDGGWVSGNTTFHLNAGTNDQAGAFAGGVRWGQGWETGTNNLTDGAWHFVVMTCNGGGKTNYVDGNVDAWMAINGALMNQWSGNGTGGQLWLGGTPDAGDGDVRLNGQLAEVYVYNRALSQTEIQSLMTAAGPVAQPVLPAVSAVSLAAGAKLDLNGLSAAVAGLSGAGTVDTTLPTGTNQLVINNSSSLNFSGLITNSIGVLTLHKTGPGALTLAGTNTYTGSTILDAGTLNLSNAAALSSGALMINGGTLDNLSGASITTNKPTIWAGDFTFNGTTNLSFGTGAATLTGPGTNRQITINANLFSVGLLTGSGGPGYGLTVAGSGTLYLGGTAASVLGGSLVLNGGTVQMSQDMNPVAALLGSGTLETSGTGVNKWFWLNNASNFTFSGTIQNYPGTTARGLGFNKTGAGTATLNGNVTFNDTITVQNGRLNLVGSGVAITNYNASGDLLTVGAVAGGRGVLSLANGATVLANYNPASVSTSSASVGTVATAAGSLQNVSGTFNSAKQLALGPTGYGAFTQSGGTTTVGGFIALGGTTNGGAFNQSGGTVTLNGASVTIGYSSTNSRAVMNLFGNAVFTQSGVGNGVWPGEVGYGTLNLWGGAVLNITNDGIVLGRGNALGRGEVNLLGGTLTAGFITNGVGTGTFNFNGGTLRANAGGTFTKGNIATSFYDYSGGAVIDDGGYAVTFNQPIQVPSGYGVASIPLTAAGSNYIDTPVVVITNISASGSGATAIAQMDYNAGTVTNILVTCPGNGYGNSDSLGISLAGGGGSGAVLGTPAFAVVSTSGGLTKLGSGSLTLGSGNTYAGPTKVLAGTLNVTPGVLNPSGNLLVSNATVALDVSSGSSVSVANLALQPNAAVSIAYGTLSGNPSFVALAASGPLSASGTNIINLTGTGFALGQFPLISYTGTALASISNFKLGSIPVGLTATLVNNAANNTIDLNITVIGQTLTWYGSVSANWDINTTFNWNSGANKYLEYGTTNLFGDFTVFDDSLNNQQYTNVILTTALHSSQITVNGSLPYSFTGSGALAGAGYLTMNDSGSLTLGTANSYSGGTFLNAGTLVLGSATALGSGALTITGGALDSSAANLVNTASNAQYWNGDFTFAGTQNLDLGSGGVTLNASRVVTVNTNTLTIGGSISGGLFSLTKSGYGTLALTGTDSLTGNTVVDQGTVALSGSGAINPANDLLIGDANGQSGALYQSGSSVITNADTGGGAFQIGVVAGAAGYYKLTGGTVNLAGEINIGGYSGGSGTFGQLDLLGGTINIPNRAAGTYFLVNRGLSGEAAVVNVLGGTIQVAGGGTPATGGFNGLAVNWCQSSTAQNAALTIGSGGQILTPSITVKLNNGGNNTAVNNGSFNGMSGNIDNVTVLNLNSGGLLQTLGFLNGTTNNPNVNVNFNGGTLKAGIAANASFLANLGGAYLYSGGATIDDNGQTIAIGQALLAPTGNGVATIAITDGGLGYTAPPQVVISGDGSGATAYATVDPNSGAVTGIVVTCPGTGYTYAPSVSLNGIGNTVSATVGTVTITANTSGGLTKNGAGSVTLSGTNNYAGTTLVNAGELLITPAHQATGNVSVADGAKFGVATSSPTNGAAIGALILGASGATTLEFSYGLSGNPTNAALLAGAVTVHGASTLRISGNFATGVFPVLHYGSLSGSFAFAAPRGVAATLSNDTTHATLYAVVTSVGGSLVWMGTNSVSPNLWDIGTTTNWLYAGLPANYQQLSVPGDAVSFNDLGSGTVTLNTNVSPASLLISNNTVNYTFQGAGTLAGTAGLLKLGTGTATLSLAGNTYTGNTTISNGVLQLGSATALPSGAGVGNVVVGSSAALDLNGLSPTLNGLTGGGNINNSSATASVLTVGSADSSITWAGSITNTGAGGNSLIKTGTNVMVVTGTNFLTSATSSQINGGTLILTNGGALYLSGSAEFWVQQNAGTATAIVDGGRLVVSNNWLVVGRNNVAAIGTLIVNHGTVQKAGANNIVVGSLAATGTLEVNGGQVLNNGNLWLGENTGANATLNLNGGLVQATQVRINGTTPTTSIANLNGGTLQATAGSTNFFVGVTVNILGGGLVFDDGGFAITNATQVWLDGDGNGGGVVKQGAGTLYLDTANTYTGTTTVSNGTLAGLGSVAGPLVVAPSGNLAAGDAGTVGSFTINNNLTLHGDVTLRVSKTGGSLALDQVVVTGNINYGGVLSVTNMTTDSTPLAVGDTFQLFSVNGSHPGNFTSVLGSAGSGLAYSFDPASGLLSVVAGINPDPTNITFSVIGSTLSLSWPTDHLGWILQMQTNGLASGLSTNWVDLPASAAMTGTNIAIIATNPAAFYRLRKP